DLAFMQTTVEALTEANPRLVPLVAHDRASFGGMLIATGLGVLLPALWGYRQGARWLWWTFLAAGVPGYAAGIGVHLAVGFTGPLAPRPGLGGAGRVRPRIWPVVPLPPQETPSARGELEALPRHLPPHPALVDDSRRSPEN